MSIHTRIWLNGLLKALFSGVAIALGANVVLDFDSFVQQLGLAGIAAAVQLAQYLAQKPMPDIEDPKWAAAQSPIKTLVQGTGPSGEAL